MKVRRWWRTWSDGAIDDGGEAEEVRTGWKVEVAGPMRG